MKPVTVVLLLAVAGPAFADRPAPVNAGFEATEPGREPSGWSLAPLSRQHEYVARVTDQRPHSGKCCLEIKNTAGFGWAHAGRVTQLLPAEPFRGKRVRFRAWVRAEVTPTRNFAALSIRAVRPGHRPGHWGDMAGRGVRSADWREYAVIADVAPDAESLEVGFYLNESGTAWFDDAAIDILGPAGAGNEPPRPLAGRGLENLTALARLLGYVRYFHPSDEAAAADWDRFAIEAVNVVEPATSAENLAGRLRELFAPVAPTVQVFPTGRTPRPDLSPPAARPHHLLAWRHRGVASNYQVGGAFVSERVTDADPHEATNIARASEPLVADLGGGVSCRVPLTVVADATGTLPRATANPRPATKPADFPPTGDDRATRLADVILTWAPLQHFYPYFDEVGTDWPAVLREAMTKAAADPDAAAFHDTLRRMIALLHDGHAVVRGGSGTAANDGALPVAWDWFEDRLVIVNADPAHAGRVKPGDVVMAVDGTPAADRMAAAVRLASGATPQFRRYRAMQDLGNGPAGSSVVLRLHPLRGPDYDVTLTRQPADDTPLRGPGLREWRLDRVTELKPGYLYVDLDRFEDGKFGREVLPRLARAKGVVFDVRGYPTVSLEFLSHFSDKPLVSELYQHVVTRLPDRRGVTYEGDPWTVKPTPPRFATKAAFLSDGRAVSYAETFLALVARNKLGPIVGGPTSGANGGVNVYVLPGGSRVSWTGQMARKLDGSRHHGVGVIPDKAVSRTIAAIAAGRDEAIEKALELIQS
ncbi:MAG TPA: S41 family peptidase [Gemmataceae bacterium]|jgi:C-terminal processing protease CtpA/Prc